MPYSSIVHYDEYGSDRPEGVVNIIRLVVGTGDVACLKLYLDRGHWWTRFLPDDRDGCGPRY